MSDPLGVYSATLRDRVAPALRSMGLRGSGSAFVLPDDRVWALIGFQSDRRLARMGVTALTINLTRADKAAWAKKRADQPWYPSRPPFNGASGMEPAESIRIGQLIPVDELNADRWWVIDDGATKARLGSMFSGIEVLTMDGTRDALLSEQLASGRMFEDDFGPPKPPQQVAEEVVAAIRDHAIRWLKAARTSGPGRGPDA